MKNVELTEEESIALLAHLTSLDNYRAHKETVMGIIEKLKKPRTHSSDCTCEGWGCHKCCNSEAEIRARQGTFG